MPRPGKAVTVPNRPALPRRRTIRFFASIVRPGIRISGPDIPGARLSRVNQSRRRRLDDDAEDLFHRACMAKDLEAAADMLAVLEKWHARRLAGHGRDQRIDDAPLQRARRELDRLKTLNSRSATGRP